MKNILLLIFFFFGVKTQAQSSESEPNNGFSTANYLSKDSVKQGNVNISGDVSDYFYSPVPYNGTVKIMLAASNTSASAGFLTLSVYDGRKSSGQLMFRYVGNNSSIGSGKSVTDTLYLYGRAKDTLYFKLETNVAFGYTFKYQLHDTGTQDTEPNNTFQQAIPIKQHEIKRGNISFASAGFTDPSDYYRTRLSADGTLRIMVSGTNVSGSTGYLYLYGYDGRKGSGTVLAKYVGNNSSVGAGKTVYDTINLYGRAVDSFYFRIEGSVAFNYKISYDIADTSFNDSEPNNNINQSLYIGKGMVKKGHVGYVSMGSADPYDYYRTNLTANGTLKIYLQAKNLGGSTSYLYAYGYDGRKLAGTVLAKYAGNNANIVPGATLFDTIYLHGRAVDSFYFRFDSPGAFIYSFYYELTDTSFSDAEPNNTVQQALPIQRNEVLRGNIMYAAKGSSDNSDYYRTHFSTDGTLKLIVSGKNQSANTGYLYLYMYDGRKNNGTIYANYVAKNANVTAGKSVLDTIILNGRAADSMYFRIDASTAFDYQIKYLLSDSTANDPEPNNFIQDAVAMSAGVEQSGHLHYDAKDGTDYYDYYKTRLSKDGTVVLYVRGTNYSGTNGYMYIQAYDGRKLNGTILGKYIANQATVPNRAVVYDTIYLYGRASDSFYVRLESPVAFSYSIKYEIRDTSLNDSESNNILAEALYIREHEERYGHIKYSSKGASDDYDYYRTRLSKDGTLKIYFKATNQTSNVGYSYLYAFDGRKLSGTILGKYAGNNASVKPFQTIYDTVYLYGRAEDSIYFRIDASTAFNYQIRYEITDTSANDREPNNVLANATEVKTDQIFKGHIGYTASGITDSYDGYKIDIPAKGTIRITTKIQNLGGTSGYVYQYGYDDRKLNGTILSRYVKSANVLHKNILYDTVYLNCNALDTFYLMLYSIGAFSYEAKVHFIDRMPYASTVYDRIGNTVGFRPQFANATSFSWDFGDGTTSTSQFPLKTYKKGFFDTKLIVTNSVCNFKDTAHEYIEVKGIEYYTPKSGGAGGDVVMEIYGGGLDTATSIRLVKGSEVITVHQKYTNSIRNHLSAIVDLHFASPGIYDVYIKIPGEPEEVYPGGFVVEGLKYPYTWSEVQGPNRFRNNVDTRFNLVIGNKGNVVASGVVLALLWPKSISIRFEDKFIVPPDTGSETVMLDGDAQKYTLKRSDYHFIYDSLNTITPIDSFAGKPYNGYIRYLLIPHVPAGSTIELPFIARSVGSGNTNFITYTHKPNMWGSCHTGNWMDYNEDLTAELIDGADMIVDKTNIPLLKAFTKTAKIGQKHAGSAASYLGKHFWAWYDGYEVDADAAMADWMQETEANNAFALQTATDEFGGFMLNKGIGKLNSTYQKQVDFINKRLANNPNMSAKLSEAYLNKLNALTGSNKRLNTLKEMFDNTKNLATLSDKLLKLQQMVDDCPELQKQLDDLKKELDKELNQQDVKNTPVTTANSFDPNELIGPVGVGANRYLNNGDRQRFQVNFENVDTASAAAQIVVIRDTLDRVKFDLRSFEFGDVSVGTKRYRVPKFRKGFVMEHYLNNGISVRINAGLDTNSGVVTWQFTSIDTLTRDLPVFEGFLPPNVSKPEGEGSVSYSILPKLPIADGTVFQSKAVIYFDQNDPIVTNTWQNIADVLPPVTTLKANVASGHTDIRLIISGTDATSGIGYHKLFVKEGSGAWVAFGGSSSDTIIMDGKPGTTYGFYCLGSDKVGNTEQKSPVAETIISVGKAVQLPWATRVVLRPNPAESEVYLEHLDAFNHLELSDLYGKVILTQKLKDSNLILPVGQLKAGVYLISLYGKQNQTLKLIKK